MFLDFEHTQIYYQTHGEGPAVFLLHGFLESSEMWDPIIPEISKKHTVVTLDFPGMGKSGVIDKTHTMEKMAEVVNALINHLQFENATLVGHSMGGYVILAFAELFPNKLNKIVLLNSSSVADSEEKKSIRDRAIDIVAINPRAFISMAIGNLVMESSHEKFQTEINNLKELAYKFPVEGIKAALRGMRDRKDRTEVLTNFSGLKYSLLSKDDPLIPVEENLKLAQKAGVETTIVSGGHMSLIENKSSVEEFLQLVL